MPFSLTVDDPSALTFAPVGGTFLLTVSDPAAIKFVPTEDEPPVDPPAFMPSAERVRDRIALGGPLAEDVPAYLDAVLG